MKRKIMFSLFFGLYQSIYNIFKLILQHIPKPVVLGSNPTVYDFNFGRWLVRIKLLTRESYTLVYLLVLIYFPLPAINTIVRFKTKILDFIE